MSKLRKAWGGSVDLDGGIPSSANFMMTCGIGAVVLGFAATGVYGVSQMHEDDRTDVFHKIDKTTLSRSINADVPVSAVKIDTGSYVLAEPELVYDVGTQGACVSMINEYTYNQAMMKDTSLNELRSAAVTGVCLDSQGQEVSAFTCTYDYVSEYNHYVASHLGFDEDSMDDVTCIQSLDAYTF